MAKRKKKILFVHQNFPGQFKFLAPALIKENYEVHAIGNEENLKNVDDYPGLEKHTYKILAGSTPGIDMMAVEFESKMLRARFAADKCEELQSKGFNPDLIIAHPGWGESFFLSDIWPEAKVLSYFEWHWNTVNSDIDFDDEFLDEEFYKFTCRKVRARNVFNYSIFENSDAIISPTNYQKATAPDSFRNKISVIHDGIDTKILKPNNNVKITLDAKIMLSKKDKIITFVNRNLEPYRGYHQFMRSLPLIFEENPDVQVFIIGASGKGYGADPPEGQTWKDIFLQEVEEKIDISRVHFLGLIDYNDLISLLQVTSVHVYLSYPFVLSWSFLEAMACGAVVAAADTEPVREVIKDKKNGIIIDFFNAMQIGTEVNKILKHPEKYKEVSKEARKTIVSKYEVSTKSIPNQIKLVKRLIG